VPPLPVGNGRKKTMPPMMDFNFFKKVLPDGVGLFAAGGKMWLGAYVKKDCFFLFSPRRDCVGIRSWIRGESWRPSRFRINGCRHLEG
jgi:hypothetical protein